MTIEELEEHLLSACEKRKAEGWTIVQHTFGDKEEKTCCLVSASELVDIDRVTYEDLGLVVWDFWALIDGFDGSKDRFDRPAYYALGKRLAEKVL